MDTRKILSFFIGCIYSSLMPGQRAPGQKQVLTMFDEDFLSEIADAMRRAGYSDRSKFIRDAVYDKLIKLGIRCNYKVAMAPDRTGKGGRPKKIKVRMHDGSDGTNGVNEAPPKPVITLPRKREPVSYSQSQKQSQQKAKS